MKLPSPYDRLLLPVYVPSLLMAVSQEALTILLPLYMLEIGASPAFAALVVGLRGIGVLLFDVPAGMLVARFGDKPVLLGGLSLILTGLLLLMMISLVLRLRAGDDHGPRRCPRSRPAEPGGSPRTAESIYP